MSLDPDATVHGAFFSRATDPRWADATALWARPDDDDDAASVDDAVGTLNVDASSGRARVSFRALLDASLALAEAMTRDDHPGTSRRSGPPRSRASDGALLADATAAVLIDSSETLIVAYFACLFAGRAFAPVETALPPAARAGILRTLAAEAGLTHVLVTTAEDARAVARDLETATHPEPPSSPSSSVGVFAVRASPTRAGALDVRVISPDAHHPPEPLRRRLDDRAWSSIVAADASSAVAHAIHTGGTTGAPKAVLCDHRGSILSHAARAAAMPFAPDDITGVVVFGVWDAVCALLAGSPVAMLPGGVLREGAEATARAMVDARATRVTLTPSLAALLVAEAEDEQTAEREERESSESSADADRTYARAAPGSSRRFASRALRNLRAATLCGESVSPTLAASLRGKLRQGATLANLYSLSEAHDVALETEDAAGNGCGAPYPHVMVRVAGHRAIDDESDFFPSPSFRNEDEFQSESESESESEGYLYLGGPALALGYLGAGGVSANASRFGVDANGARWYATGDVAKKMRSDGRLRLVGRGAGATEAKVRGARVDLVAAEEALRAHPAVADCACVARRIVFEDTNGREGSGSRRDVDAATTVAFVVLLAGRRREPRRDDEDANGRDGSCFEEEARAWMRARVPIAAVPSRVVTLEKLPLTAAAGSSAPKCDRRALETVPVPERRRRRERRAMRSNPAGYETTDENETRDGSDERDERDGRVARMTALAARLMRETLPSLASSRRDEDDDEDEAEGSDLDADHDLGFAASGGASLAAQRLLAALRRADAAWNALTPADLMAADTPRRMAAAAAAAADGHGGGTGRAGGTGGVGGEFGSALSDQTGSGVVSRSEGDVIIPRGALSTEEMFAEAAAFARDALSDAIPRLVSSDPGRTPSTTPSTVGGTLSRTPGAPADPPGPRPGPGPGPGPRSFVVSRAGGIFLTGATGLLGGALAREILRVARPDATLFCLTRAEDDAAASTRVFRALADPESGVVDPRVRAVAGDASERRFGLSPETYARLASEIDLVVHAAGTVHALAPYASMRSSNATPATEATRLAATRPGQIGLAHVSSSAVLPPVGARGDARNPAGAAEETDAAWASRRPEFARVGSGSGSTGSSGGTGTGIRTGTPGWGERETSGVDALASLASSGGYDTAEAHGGTYQAYAQAKWVAETVVWTAARDAGVPAVVIRPGNVAPRSSDGEGWRRDATMALAIAAAATGANIAQTGWWRLWWTPADVVARAVVAAANAPESFRTGIAAHVDPVDPVDAGILIREIQIAARRSKAKAKIDRGNDEDEDEEDDDRENQNHKRRDERDDGARTVEGVDALRETLREALRRDGDGDASDALLFRLPPATAAAVEATLEATSGLEGALGLCERRMDATETRKAFGRVMEAFEERKNALEILRTYARAAAASFDYHRNRPSSR